MVTLNLRGELGRRLTISVHGYERDTSHDPYDANWLRCSAEVELGQFHGSVDAAFTTHDFARFLSELAQVVQGAAVAASFQTIEECLSIRVEVDRAGRVVVRGKLREIDSEGAALSFAFDSDLSFLRETQSELIQVASEFPERKGAQ